MSRRLAEAGFEVVPQSAQADLYVLNTCSVTHVADAKGRQWLGGGAEKESAGEGDRDWMLRDPGHGGR